MQSYVIHFLRNMPCRENLEGRYIGRTDPPLADSSIQAVLALKQAHPYPQSPRAFYASPHIRCVDTLRLFYPQADPEVILEMAECDFGDWEGKTAQELKQDPAFAQWLEGGSPPNGESGAVFYQRVCQGFEALVRNLMAQKQTEAVLCVPGGVMGVILSAYGLPRAQPFDWLCAPGCGYSARITPALWMRGCVMEVYGKLPQGIEDDPALDKAREAASRAWGPEEGSDAP